MKKRQTVVSVPKKQNFELYLIRDPDVSWTELSSQIALVNIKSSSFYTLNETGALIWKLANRNTLAEIEKKLAAEYETSAQDFKTDIWDLACELVREGLASFSQELPSRTK